jgi:hypothetical protein
MARRAMRAAPENRTDKADLVDAACTRRTTIHQKRTRAQITTCSHTRHGEAHQVNGYAHVDRARLHRERPPQLSVLSNEPLAVFAQRADGVGRPGVGH